MVFVVDFCGVPWVLWLFCLGFYLHNAKVPSCHDGRYMETSGHLPVSDVLQTLLLACSAVVTFRLDALALW